jgi:Tfp pilus assembly protein PilP
VSTQALAGLSMSTYTVSSLYTGDHYRDPFIPSTSGGGPVRAKNPDAPTDIHALRLQGIMQDARSSFALFSAEDGSTLILRGGRLYDSRNKRVPGIAGHIDLKRKRADLITADKDVQIYTLGATDGEDEGK